MMTEKLMKNTKIFFEVSIIIICFIFIYFRKQQLTYPRINISKQDSATNINQTFINLFNAGEKQLLSSLLWVQTILDSDLEHYKKNDSNNWMFLRFNTIISLDPRFYEAYLYGGQYLSVIKDDNLGARIIYEKGIEKFPYDYHINYNAAFHYYFELNNLPLAVERYTVLEKKHNLIKRAPRLISLINKLRTKNKESIEDSIYLVKTSYESAPKNSYLKKYYYKKLHSLYVKRDLMCLNSSKDPSRCNVKGPHGEEYIKNEKKLFEINSNN